MIRSSQSRRPWKRALGWLFFLGPFFFLSYGFANWFASTQENVGSVVFEWERAIPFLAWTIIPYWIIDLLYGASFFICKTKRELNRHGLRLFTAQVIAVICFIAFPLKFSFQRPDVGGLPGFLFAALSDFDRPFNQAPSLHIALLVILWVLYHRHVAKPFRALVHLLGALICVSVLTTYQHHFVDIPTGALLGWFCVWLWPMKDNAPLASLGVSKDAHRWRLAFYYLVGASFFAAIAYLFKGIWLWLLWPAVSLFFVASFYIVTGAEGFQKSEAGKLSSAAKWLLGPYLLGAKLNSYLWTRGKLFANELCEGVYLGRFPSSKELQSSGIRCVVDLTAEMSAPKTEERWVSVPCLDLVTPGAKDLSRAARFIDRLRDEGPVLVSCALGYSRSASAVATWLIATHQVKNVEEALEVIRSKRPQIVIDKEKQESISSAVEIFQREEKG